MAVHRKHHTCADKEGDPHSPYLCGFWNIFFFGYRYYLREAKNPETLKSYGHGAPSDSIEKHFYGPYKRLGILILLLLDVSLFGLFGILTWIIQMIWIPFWAIGMVNAMGHMGPNHWFGYSVSTHNRVDHSLNIMPIFLYPLALLISVCTWGESLHSAHHDDVSNPNFARRWWEIDPGYFTLYVLWLFDLVKSRKPHQAVLPG